MRRLLLFAFSGILILGLLLCLVTAFAVFHLQKDLPEVAVLKNVHFQIPLRIYSQDQKLVAEFGEKKRTPVAYQDVPPALIQAFLAAEDSRFFQHHGIDFKSILRAVKQMLLREGKQTGASTITMQLARNFFLSNDRTLQRKIKEILLAIRIENTLSKEEIFTLYVNKIFLGFSAYGVGAAANTYYNKSIHELSLAQVAMLASLPKGPSTLNPIVNPERAKTRRDWVLQRMLFHGFITTADYEKATAEDLSSSLHLAQKEVEADYVAEMIRIELLRNSKYLGAITAEELYTGGYKVYATIDSEMQQVANRSLRQGLMDYDRRHGYRGAETYEVELVEDLKNQHEVDIIQKYADKLQKIPDYDQTLIPAFVLSVQQDKAKILVKNRLVIDLPLAQISWARKYIDVNRRGKKPQKIQDIFQPGQLIRMGYDAEQETWELRQKPDIEGALVALDPKTGSVQSLVGGYAYSASKFNRAVQAERQMGSSFKPFVYAAAIDSGLSAATVLNDAPIIDREWLPNNSDGRFSGAITLREGFYLSRNLIAIRILDYIKVHTVKDYAEKFGFDKTTLPHDLSLALGTANSTPLQLATAYSVFANGGYRVEPYIIERIENNQGQVVYQADPVSVCMSKSCVAHASAPRVMEPQVAYIMDDMMRDVIQKGTGRRASKLRRNDIAGKTGTTNDSKDAWFAGYHPNVVTVVWAGFDQPDSLGRYEYGNTVALPIWMDYMQFALKDQPIRYMQRPPGIVSVKINPRDGLLAGSNDAHAVEEIFRIEHVPNAYSASSEVYDPYHAIYQ